MESPDRGNALTARAAAVREVILQQSKRAGVGHIGSALSVVDILVALHFAVMSRPDPHHSERDRFILSKGHAALALYAVLHLCGLVGDDDLNSFCADGSALGVHPDQVLTGVDFSTGSLGHGLSVGVGCALAARLRGSDRRTFVLISDAELNEGSVWEAALFAAHHSLSSLHLIVDCNAQQAFGYTKDVLDLEPLREKWLAFGWKCDEVPGHDPDKIVAALNGHGGARPHVVIARTVFGYGVSFMERRLKWHYLPMTDEEFAMAMDEVRRSQRASAT
jgi:transketolase